MMRLPPGAISIPMLLLAAVLACGGCRARPLTITDEIRVDVADVDLDRDTGLPFVMLQDKPGKRALKVMIGEPEAKTIILQLHGITPPRPLTSDLLRSLVQKTGNHVDRIVIDDLRNDTYYADIYLDRGRYRIDSRPSDAIALALGVNAPIYVVARLLEPESSFANRNLEKTPQTVAGAGVTVQELSPDIAANLGAAPQTGVLISDVSAEALQAGVQRGDVLVKIGGKDIKTLEDFRRELAGLKAKSVVLTLERGDAQHEVTVPVTPQDRG